MSTPALAQLEQQEQLEAMLEQIVQQQLHRELERLEHLGILDDHHEELLEGAGWQVSATGEVSGPQDAVPAPTGLASIDTANLEAALAAAAEQTRGLVSITEPGVYAVARELIEPSNVSIILGPATMLQAAAGFTGEAVLSSAVNVLSTGKMVVGGGTIDANNIAPHAFWPRYFKHATFGIVCQNSLEGDVIIGDNKAPATSIEAHLTSKFWVSRTAGAVPAGHYALWVQNCSDGRAACGPELKGQETGIRVDHGGWKWTGGIHPYGAGFAMQVCAEDNAGVEWYGANFDTPTPKEHALATGEAASSTITDTEVLSQHAGRPVSGTNIPAGAYVGTVTAGVSWTLVNKKGEEIKPSGAVAGVTLAGVGLLCRTSGVRVIGGQVFNSKTYGVDGGCYGIVAAPGATGIQGVIYGFRSNATDNTRRVSQIITGNTGNLKWRDLEQNNVITTIESVYPSEAALLARVQYAPGEQAKLSTESTALTYASREHLGVKFVAPASGDVLVDLQGPVTQTTASDHVLWGLLDGAEVAHGNRGVVCFTNSANIKELSILVEGLTPGETYELFWAWAVNAGKGEMNIQNTPLPPAAASAPATMKVWAA